MASHSGPGRKGADCCQSIVEISLFHSLRMRQSRSGSMSQSPGFATHRDGLHARTDWLEMASTFFRTVLWLVVGPLGCMRGEPFQEEFADQIRHSIRARSGQTIEDD